MSKFKLFTCWIILAITPSFLLYPHDLSHADFHVQLVHSRLEKNIRKTERYHLVTFDEILSLLEDIESGKEYREKDLRRINRFLVYLAKKGELPDRESNLALREDIQDLLDDDNEYVFAELDEGEYSIIPAIYNDQADVIFCKSWFSSSWKKTRKFIKKHKTEIIIGAVIVVATATVVVAIVATSSAGAVAVAAGAAKAVASSKSAKEEKSGPKSNEPLPALDTSSIIETTHEAPVLAKIVDEQVSYFKEFMVEDQLMQQCTSSQDWSDLSFGEKARELGAFLAHQTLEEISEIASVLPQLSEELKDVGSQIFPESLIPSESGEYINSPGEDFENLVVSGHLAIDKAFSSDQADLYAAEYKTNKVGIDFAIGLIPLPSGVLKLFSDTNKLVEAGNIIDRAGFTRAGRGLMKHGYREGSLFPKPLGNPSQINKQGETILKEILNDPKKIIIKNDMGGIEIYAQSGRGAYYREDRTFRGFIEHGRK